MGSDADLPAVSVNTRAGRYALVPCFLHDSLIIRCADKSDAEELAHLEKCNFPLEQYGSDVLSAQKFRYFLTRANALTLTARNSAAIYGYAIILFRTNSNIARLYTLAVDQSMRGKGLATDLLKRAEDLALSAGCSSMILETRADNTAMQKLCDRGGYRKKAVLEAYYADESDAYKYIKSLRA